MRLHLVSVPYRGATFLNHLPEFLQNQGIGFPSPIGELHFSIMKHRWDQEQHSCFRPLSGSYISQLDSSEAQNRLHGLLFPSPIGELHFSIISLNTPDFSTIVSVPYRGATFLNICLPCVENWLEEFPSPIGELHFSMVKKKMSKFATKAFPSPIGELHFSMEIQHTD